ncbi:MT-A70-domain-containing protein [Parasitella parasitica]|nr:MT-A70-domain-containing protein [Parasitella parasitica]
MSLHSLLKRELQLQQDIAALQSEIDNLETKADIDGQETEQFRAPAWCIPIKANVMTFEWDRLAEIAQFDVILVDPPCQLATNTPTRGVAISYEQLPDASIAELPIPKLQENGFLFLWVINSKYTKGFELMAKWGYTYVDEITWVKQTVNRRLAKGHGYYLQHAKETCLVGKKGQDPANCSHSLSSDVICSERRGQSQKPEELYQLIEQLVPNGRYLEIFGRKNNLRDYWVTIGNEL